MAEWMFWITVCLLGYTYLGYPATLFFYTYFRRKTVPSQAMQPFVTIVIAAYNEEDVIVAKLENTLQLLYPAGLLRIVVVADGSTDHTVELVQKFEHIQLLYEPGRSGKSAALNRALQLVTSEIVVLTDANTFLPATALMDLMAPFANEQVGGVAGAKKVKAAGKIHMAGPGEGVYWKYESWLKRQEASFYTVVGAAGELFAFRRSLFRPIPSEAITDDFYLSLSINLQGKTISYAPAAIATEPASLSLQDEWKRKVRIAAGGFQSLVYFTQALNPFRHPRLAFQFFSHRVLRWVVTAPALLSLWILNGWLVYEQAGLFFEGLFVLQCVFYFLALLGYLFRYSGKMTFLQLPLYFVMMHAALPVGAWRYVTGRQSVMWQKAKRTAAL